ncbi:hypothetical protein GCM10009069_00730 [Algimonas arctica]|uniref:Phosphatidate cytidylyltransferase n=1 Tax=Algimonas arctica TaxID=1479486 RepID=A0A8J3G128_9PROT|nr:hypothetical protein [Algimonas arctica]GHA81552.1 hypothetical protein GCM10009069_00730 [Algimonas arctica]
MTGKNTGAKSDQLLDLIRSEQLDPPARVHAVMNAIRTRHSGRVLGFVYYGSSLRDLDDAGKMLDFYVLVDSYRKTHGSTLSGRWRALTNRLIPPAVYYLEQENDGVLSTCKYSIITLDEFERRCSDSFLSQVWGRFSQPCALLDASNPAIEDRILQARVAAVRKLARETAPLFDAPATAPEFWGRAFYESYRTELRPESDDGRAQEIVARYQARYDTVSETLFGASDNGQYAVETYPGNGSKFRWFMRRMIGRPIAAIRVLNSAATFDGGLDYVLRKVERHSGVSLEVTKAQRKHPVLWSPVLGWKLWRRGAFR